MKLVEEKSLKMSAIKLDFRLKSPIKVNINVGKKLRGMSPFMANISRKFVVNSHTYILTFHLANLCESGFNKTEPYRTVVNKFFFKFHRSISLITKIVILLTSTNGNI